MHNRIKLNINKEIKSYLLGFLFSIALTVLPFFLTTQKIFSDDLKYTIILLCAMTQIVVHFIFFLHLNFSTTEGQWNIITLLFVIVIMFIVVFGSIWIMFHLNHHMLFY